MLLILFEQRQYLSKKRSTSLKMIAANRNEAGMVNTHAQEQTLPLLPHVLLLKLAIKPTPTMEPVMVCVVETGIPEFGDSKGYHCSFCCYALKSIYFRDFFEPIVFTIFIHHSLYLKRSLHNK